jgi:hypothetical protein
MVKKLNIYFIHSKELSERENVFKNFEAIFKQYRFKNIVLNKINVIEDFDSKDITANTIQQYVRYDKITETQFEFYNQLYKNMHINQLSNTLKHFKALEMISAKSHERDINLVLEDDILYEDKVCLSFDKLVKTLPKTYDFIMLGMPTLTEVSDKTTFNFEDTHKIFKVLPLSDSYIVSTAAAKAVVPHYVPLKFINNIQMSYVTDKLGLSTLQAIPNIFIDGSKYGLFLSKLSTNNPLIFNNDYTTLRNILSKGTISKDEDDIINKLIDRSTIRNNPDFIHLECQYHILCKNYEKAKNRYEEAYKIYVSNGCILNNESLFL